MTGVDRGGAASGKVLGGGVLTDADRRHAERVLAYAPQELASVRAAAEKWQTAMAALAGAVAAYTALRGPDDIASLRRPWPVVIGVSIALGLGLVLFAGLLAMRAAFGLPRLRSTALGDAGLTDHQSAIRATRLLRTAIWLASGAVPLLFAAVGATWFAPPGGDPATTIVVDDGEHLCGEVLRVAGGVAVIDTSDGERSVPVADIVALGARSACP
ncbi:MAG TPA: hypothetical protein VFI46_04860 [Jiangellaceae bacterium]|nr:hypothetical protein [Jiangellaceae bacterium]